MSGVFVMTYEKGWGGEDLDIKGEDLYAEGDEQEMDQNWDISKKEEGLEKRE
ncbi:hypothetical protein GF362_03810 [Candidatus Dojkabacteria bacterium]|nr:hypothetical protein [Candidatus Dojkabacteria bacterium]